MSAPVRTIAVVGSGVPAVTAALALARAYGGSGVRVTFVDTGGPISPHAAFAAAPDIRAFHRLLGVEEKALLGQGAALTLGQQFVGWPRDGNAFTHAYGDAGRPFASLPFIQHWTRARQAGLKVALEEFCLAAVAARHGRVGIGGEAATPYGYHLDAARYFGLLRSAAEAAGVAILCSGEARAEIVDDRIGSVQLTNGQVIEADLYVDAGVLLHPALERSQSSFCDRVIRASGAPLDPLPIHARMAAHPAGFVAFTPLADRTAIEFAYASEYLTDEEASAALPGIVGLPIVGRDDPAPTPQSLGSHRWAGNCVAIGGKAGAVLDAAALLDLQLSIGQLVLLLPVDRGDMSVEAGIYNSEVGGQAERVADFTAMHFHLNSRDEPFWQAARAAPISEALRAKIALFQARGMFAHFDHEAHVVDSWTLSMAGHGLVPDGYDPQADRVDEREAMAAFQGQLQAVAQQVRAMPLHRQALAELARR